MSIFILNIMIMSPSYPLSFKTFYIIFLLMRHNFPQVLTQQLSFILGIIPDVAHLTTEDVKIFT